MKNRTLALVVASVALVVALTFAISAAAADQNTTAPVQSHVAAATSVSTVLPAAAAPRATKSVYIAPKYGKKYHLKGCRTIKNRSIKKVTLKWAKANGYTRCKVCKP